MLSDTLKSSQKEPIELLDAGKKKRLNKSDSLGKSRRQVKPGMRSRSHRIFLEPEPEPLNFSGSGSDFFLLNFLKILFSIDQI